MRQIFDIRKLYNPIQPTVNGCVNNVLYNEFLPDVRLQDFIYCYWELKTIGVLHDPFTYSVVADGCIDVFLDMNDTQDSSVMGFCQKYMEFSLGKTFHYVGIRFLPTMFPAMFNIDASELTNRCESLEHVLPALSGFFKTSLSSQNTLNKMGPILDNYFCNFLSKNIFYNDIRVHHAINYIITNFSTMSIERDLSKEISARQLRRLFEFYIGDTAKRFSQVIRFQNILKLNPSVQYFRKNKPFFDMGYYDQTHFIKEFKQFYGVSPKQAFGK
ncbi:AraC family transcriptional regulator [Dysgonomonas sp. HDW5B]|uniref:AraC family transcriptional regulator n=1 Tax=Dysgonomonas sp. HDW5B TaxID=2714927 RepID=UPI001407F6AF|nr:helix-turn-helix domain-containing protein [Dysgonomonas sp. HDW5B]QIK55589.1 AraC family transcriptional regulator [Dysgonomonas sp. HDW5B]